MSDKTLVAYATMYGSTREVAEAVAVALREDGSVVDVRPAAEVKRLADYGPVILGAPLIMHRFHKDARKFLARNREELQDRPVAIFALGPCTQDEQEWSDCRGQLADELQQLEWLSPVEAELFGGRFDPELLRFPLNKFAGAAEASDARDWEAIRRWATGLEGRMV